MKSYEKLLLQNKAWAAEQIGQDPEFFSRLSSIQKPEFLWIGCSDSRVPANEITNTAPGEIFVHRNIANLVHAHDLNLMSVLHYAVSVLKVKHVIVCGHYGCGGVRAALDQKPLGILDQWLANIRDTISRNETELKAIADESLRADRLTELNIQQQVRNLAQTSIIRDAWNRDAQPVLHGWVYRLNDGLLHSLSRMESGRG